MTVDFLLNDYVTVANEDIYQKIMLQLFDGRSKKEKELAVNIVRLLFAEK